MCSCNRDNRELWFHPCHTDGLSLLTPDAEGVRLVLLGPPGVGKGTQAALLCRRFAACHLSTGDLFRAAGSAAEVSPAMEKALAAMRRGDLVSDDLVMELVRERRACMACAGGILLDGVPRTVSQARVLSELLEELGVVLDAAVLYELSEDEITARICGRRTCPRCKAVFHVTGNPPAKEGICNGCGAELIQREDDRPDVVRVRLAAYRDATLPVRDFYADRGELVAVSAAGTPEEVYKRTSLALATHKGMSGSRRIARAVEPV